MNHKTALVELADFCTSFHLEREEIKEKMVLCLLDALECCLDGTNQDVRTRGAYHYVKDGSGPAALFGRTERVRAEQAAFYNTVTGSVSSRNDISKKGSCHPGAIVVPVVLALANQYPCTGQQVLEGMVCGYESMIRLGTALKKAKINPSFRSTALVAPFGAAFAAAKIMGLDANQTCSAASLSCHSAGGVNNWAIEGTGEDVFQNAWGARNGIEACRLAAAGVHASRSVLEGSNGLLCAFGASMFVDELTAGLGERFDLLEVEHKPMNSCFKLQAPCQAARRLMMQERFQPDEIIAIEIGVSEHALHHAGSDNIQVESAVQAIMSIPFGVTHVLISGEIQGIAWEPPYDREVFRLMSMCSLNEQERWTRSFPGRHGADVTVKLRDGRVLHAEQPDVDCLSPLELHTRFRTTAEQKLGAERAERLIWLLQRLDRMEQAAVLNDALSLK